MMNNYIIRPDTEKRNEYINKPKKGYTNKEPNNLYTYRVKQTGEKQ